MFMKRIMMGTRRNMYVMVVPKIILTKTIPNRVSKALVIKEAIVK
jgi:hypothetical protein